MQVGTGRACAWGHKACNQAGCWERTWDSWDLKDSDGVSGINISSLNIRSRRVGGLEAALRELKQGNVDVGVL